MGISICLSDDRPLVQYEYEGRFKYERFLYKITPILHEYLEMPEVACVSDESTDMWVDDLPYDRELCDMLDAMGVGKYDGLKGVYETFECTYISAPVLVQESEGATWRTYPMNVKAVVSIVPKGYSPPQYTIPSES